MIIPWHKAKVNGFHTCSRALHSSRNGRPGLSVSFICAWIHFESCLSKAKHSGTSWKYDGVLDQQVCTGGTTGSNVFGIHILAVLKLQEQKKQFFAWMEDSFPVDDSRRLALNGLLTCNSF